MTDRPLVVLALDIAKHRTGWAIGSPKWDRPYWGVWEMPMPWDRHEAERLDAFYQFLTAKIADRGVTYIAMERLLIDMQDFNYNGTVPMAQMHGTALLAARHKGCRQGAVAIQSWRAHFLGQAAAPKHLGKAQRTNWLKDEALKKAHARNWYCTVHDEAEALGIMDFALWCMDEDYQHKIGPFIRRAELKASEARYRGEAPAA